MGDVPPAVWCLVVTKHKIMDADTFRLMRKKRRGWLVDAGKSGILPPLLFFSVSLKASAAEGACGSTAAPSCGPSCAPDVR